MGVGVDLKRIEKIFFPCSQLKVSRLLYEITHTYVCTERNITKILRCLHISAIASDFTYIVEVNSEQCIERLF